MANFVILTGIITEISELQRDSSGKEWINFKLKVLQEGDKETIIPCSASGSLAVKLDSSCFYPKDSVEVTGILSSIERVSRVGNYYYELKVYAHKVLNLKGYIGNEEFITKSLNYNVSVEKQAFPTELGDLDEELPF